MLFGQNKRPALETSAWAILEKNEVCEKIGQAYMFSRKLALTLLYCYDLIYKFFNSTKQLFCSFKFSGFF